VSSEYKPKFHSPTGKVVKVMFDVSDDVNVDMKRKLAVIRYTVAEERTNVRPGAVVSDMEAWSPSNW
jgi:hypothetical protein